MSGSAALDSDLVRLRAAAALRAHVGDHAAVSRDLLAQVTGCEARTLKAHLCGETIPSLPAFLAYSRALPATYPAAVLALAGVTGLRKVEGATTAAEALREVTEAAATLAAALADGRIDHTEWPAVRKECGEALAAIAQLLSQGERS